MCYRSGMKKPTPLKPPASRPTSNAFTAEQEEALKRVFPGVDWSKTKVVVDNTKTLPPKKD
jgi:hypothetical protein